MTADEARRKFDRALTKTSGFFDMYHIAKDNGIDNTESIKKLILKELSDITNNDEVIDALYDADMDEEYREQW